MILLSHAGWAQQPLTGSRTVAVRGFTSGQLTTGPISYYIDASGHGGLNRILQTPFDVPYDLFKSQFNQSPTGRVLWQKFEITNHTDSILQMYLYCGRINYLNLYFVAANRPVQKIQGGYLYPFQQDHPFLEQLTQTSRLQLLPFQKGELYLELIQQTEFFTLDDTYLYSEPALFQKVGEHAIAHQQRTIFPLLFLGIMICQLLYVMSQWLITRRREYAYYFFYLLVIAVYFLSVYEISFQVRFLFTRYPSLSIYLNKTLLMLPYFFYFRFIRSFLEMPLHYPVMNKWIIRTEYFVLTYLVLDLTFIIITYQLKLERELFAYVLTVLFIVCTGFMIYLFNQRKTLIYFIVSGSLFVGLGNIIGLVLDYLENEKITRHVADTLIFSEVGIILEVFCFTAGLSYKAVSTEKEKIKSQENLIEQLKANELLQNKMQNIRNTLAQDLHDDIGSTLSSISILSNLALKEKNADHHFTAMHEIKDSSISLMEKMDDIVWSINPKNDSLDNLLLRVKRFATALFEAKNIDYTIRIQENMDEVKLPMEWRQHIYLICKEAINNLVKYADATQALIEVSYQKDTLELLIQDDGRGFDSSKPFTGNGLLSMRNRSDQMAALLEIDSAAGQGSRIGLKIKIK